ncbi:MAG: hypothetical protein M0R39_04040 [Prolixibacteraceae bacterium]|nr:hypothetical protein [Prolixibacteraceae bacterium]
MRKHIQNIIASIFILGMVVGGCRDKYTEEYLSLEPVYLSYKDFRASVKVISQHDLVKPGKIYTIGNYIFINEIMKGVHVYNNLNPAAPAYVGFINIPGNVDLAVKNNIMYADSYLDLVAIDITDPANAKEVGRVKEVFPYSLPAYTQTEYRIGQVDNTKGVVVDWEVKTVRKEIETINYPIYPMLYGAKSDMVSANVPGSAESSSSGSGGSMARFGLTGNSLVAVGNYLYYNFDLTDPGNPKLAAKSQLNWGIETMFLTGKNMFLGTTNGMLVYDLSDPNKPVYLSTFWHATGCDPVVVQNNRAYVTIRGGNMCGSLINRLDVLDVTTLTKPVLIRSYNMDNPYGLGINDDILFVCDGTSGLKIYNAADPLQITEHLLARFPNIQAYDVIPLSKSLLMIGSDGFYQYDYSDLTNIKQISVIRAKK